MRLRTRLLAFGALFPLGLLLLAIVSVGFAFERVVLEEHDRALLTQAGVEAVSLFDRASTPHLHLLESPLEGHIREFAPRGALYDEDGELVTRYPVDADVPSRLVPTQLSSDPVLGTTSAPGGRERTLSVRVDDPRGHPYALWLSASLLRHDRELTSYWRIAWAAWALVAGVLLTVQIAHARRLAGRIAGLAHHMRDIRAGRLDQVPPPDVDDDEIRELRDAIADATLRLAAARSSQDRLIADAAHELRTPLAALRTEIDVALRRERSSEALRQSLDHARIEVERLTSLSGHLLDLAALRATPLERVQGNLVPVLMEAIDAARAQAETRGGWVQLQAPEQAPCEFSPTGLRQALDNLLSNAIKFSPADSELGVALERHGHDWHFRVRDRGPGIPPDAAQRIFEPFNRLARDRGESGAGLGLAIVKDIADAHGGRVWTQPDPAGGGSEFVLSIPCKNAPQSDADTSPRGEGKAAG